MPAPTIHGVFAKGRSPRRSAAMVAQQVPDVGAVIAVAQARGDPLQLARVNEIAIERDLLRTRDLASLTLFRVHTNSAASSRLSGVLVSSQA